MADNLDLTDPIFNDGLRLRYHVGRMVRSARTAAHSTYRSWVAKDIVKVCSTAVAARGQLTVLTGSVMERSHITLPK